MDQPAIEAPTINDGAEFERHELEGGSGVDLARGWLTHPDAVYEHLAARVDWQQGKVWRYERYVEEPGGSAPAVRCRIRTIRSWPTHNTCWQQHYPVTFDGFGLAYYRNNRDSVAMHATTNSTGSTTPSSRF